jgi:cardiolipin synthase
MLSILRLLGVPLYFLLVSKEEFLAAVFVLFLAGATDYLDGKIARRFNQTSKLGELLDPAADRLYVAAIVYSLWDLEVIPLILLVVIFVRDVVLGVLLLFMKRQDIEPFKVTYLGKAATFNLLYAFPFLLLTLIDQALVSSIAYVLGWAFSAWGIALYLWTGILYLKDGIRLLRARADREIELS